MCVFLSLRADKANLEKKFDSTFVEEEDFGPRYVENAFRFPRWPVITAEKPGEIRLMTWGLIPSWMKDPEPALKFRMNTVNARAETIWEKPAFRNAARSRHCLVLADGFFEFREVDGHKIPYYIRVTGGRPFAIAGLFEYWPNPVTGERVPGFSVITTQANSLMETIHNRKKRMPVMLPGGEEKLWLDPGEGSRRLLRPYPAEEMEAWPVSSRITSRSVDIQREEILKEVDYPELRNRDYSQGSLF
jgi:putative SOS response-associated peptidase YedK